MGRNKWLFILVLAILMGFSGIVGQAVAADGDAPAPSAILAAKDFHIEDFHGQVVLLDFWASWCGPCKESVPWLVKMQHKYGSEGLVVVPVNLDRNSHKALKMLQQLGPDLTRVVDPEGDLAALYDLEGMPSSFIYDRQGKLVASHVGFNLQRVVEREDEIRSILAKGTSE
ncbi:redoxin family protein [bacterium]|nr:redoxin family protein [bacterium]PJA73402.1 MAG: hypothetical protein CO151_13655 [bacterium CG_4_9_14_3_um_filter_65_15]